VHVHVFQPAAVYGEMLSRLSLRVLNICVIDKYERGFGDGGAQQLAARALSRATHRRAAWCSTFDPQHWEEPGFAERTTGQLDVTFRNGAVAVKIYKDIGLILRSRSGEYLMPDNPIFSPILDAIADRDKTLFAHIAEPSAAWRPPDPANPHYSYYKEYPDWNMFLHPERPSKKAILDARDRMLRDHPKLRVVGCHLGSMEENVDDIARRLDLYANFAVDTAERIADLSLQPRDKVRRFLIQYQDRVIYGTDLSLMPWQDPVEMARQMEETYARDWKFFSTDQMLQYGGRSVRGLALPEPVLRKLYRDNAIKWVPGIVSPH
jgi:predicted TIM-barrel fold metal-dependent hydrolase